ncbi:MAG: M2 family metallopeptidase [Bryobacterales bacterium]|nr:M2 family metallopeptidase [Bryobacterales bacterium]
MRLPGATAAWLAVLLLAGCAERQPVTRTEAQDFLRMYEEVDQRLGTVRARAGWNAATDAGERNLGELVGARKALAAFQGSRFVIENSRRLLSLKPGLSEPEFRELDKILLMAAEAPATIPDVVDARIETEARLTSVFDGFQYCLETRQGHCIEPVTPPEIEAVLAGSRDLGRRLRAWEAARQPGAALREDFAAARNLRNRVATELGYSSYFQLQVADYGMSVAEMMKLMDDALSATQPLYRQLHAHAVKQLAGRYQRPAPEEIPAHWLPDAWGRHWPGLAQGMDLDGLFRDRKPEWIVQQAERFCTSLGWPPLPRGFWQKSDLYPPPAGSKRRKSVLPSTWHIDLEQDVRCLLNVSPSYRWFETSHQELGQAYYCLAYSNPEVPVMLREGANRAFHEAIGLLLAGAAGREAYLRQAGVLPPGRELDRTQRLLNEAYQSVASIPWSAGVVTRFEHEIYEKKLPEDRFNQYWWDLVRRYQGIVPPSPRGEEHCDPCAERAIAAEPARYYDHAMAQLIRYQLHDYIAREILRQDPRDCSYYGNQEAGKWLWEIMRLGSTRGWRQLLRDKTGEDLSPRAMVEYFKPLQDYLDKAGAAP